MIQKLLNIKLTVIATSTSTILIIFRSLFSLVHVSWAKLVSTLFLSAALL